MPRTAKTDPAAKGIYPRKKSYWLRYTVARKQLRVPLHTRDFAEAVERAKEIRGRPQEPKPARPKPGETPTWKQAIALYINDKLAGRKPAHLGKKRVRKFRPGTATRTADIIDYFGRWTTTRSPFDVTAATLRSYYDLRKKTSVSSAKTISDRIACFLDHLGHFVSRPVYDEEDVKEIREVTVEPSEYEPMIDGCDRYSLKFVLFAGFHCGMRRAEIVHARPAWFHLTGENPHVTVPAKETQYLANGKRYLWRSKNGKKDRRIPLTSRFRDWLIENMDPKALFCIAPDSCSKRYRFDPRKSFESYMRKCGRPDVTMHAMRHSYITMLCNSSDNRITIMKVSSWSGDEIETIQRHYWHRNVSSDGVDDVVTGQKREDKAIELLKSISERIDSGELSSKEATNWISEYLTPDPAGSETPPIPFDVTAPRKRDIDDPWVY